MGIYISGQSTSRDHGIANIAEDSSTSNDEEVIENLRLKTCGGGLYLKILLETTHAHNHESPLKYLLLVLLSAVHCSSVQLTFFVLNTVILSSQLLRGVRQS